MEAQVRVERVGEVAVVSLQGEHDLDSVAELRSQLQSALEAQPRALVVELSRTSFMDSTALGALVAAARRAALAGCTFCVADPSPNVARILAVTGLNRVWPTYESVAAAAAAAQKADPSGDREADG